MWWEALGHNAHGMAFLLFALQLPLILRLKTSSGFPDRPHFVRDGASSITELRDAPGLSTNRSCVCSSWNLQHATQSLCVEGSQKCLAGWSRAIATASGHGSGQERRKQADSSFPWALFRRLSIWADDGMQSTLDFRLGNCSR